MTIVINKSNPVTSFITTVSEINPDTNRNSLELFNLFTNVNYSFDVLPIDSSEYPERYNQFDIPTETFVDLLDGTYKYTFKDSEGRITETGLAKVITDSYTDQEEVDNNYIYIPTATNDDDFIVYNA